MRLAALLFTAAALLGAAAKAARKLPAAPGPRGARAYPGAPPALPHPVFMRENCQACHGRERHPGMRRNPHPGRADCRSCHLPQE
jgi:cytochrome c-type protein NapB